MIDWALIKTPGLGFTFHRKFVFNLRSFLLRLVGGDPNAPSSSLDLIQPDLVDTIVNIAKPPEAATLSSPKQIGKQKK